MNEQENMPTVNRKSVPVPSTSNTARKAVDAIPTRIKSNYSDPFALDREVLAHQLEGVMFHSDMVLMYTLLGCKKMCEVHWHQLFEEMKTHTCTAKDMVKRYGRIIEAKPTEKIEVYTSDTLPDSKEGIEKLKSLAMKEWHEWELETQKLYEKMVMMQPHVTMWTKL